MYTKDVACDFPDCQRPVAYKIAAPWTSGKFTELKSYGLACADHFRHAFRDAKRRFKEHAYSPEESVGPVHLYHFEKGIPDRKLERLKTLEDTVSS